MSWEVVAAHMFLPSAVAAAAAVGAWRCWRLLRYARDPRLQMLMWFYALFASSFVPWAIWMGQVAFQMGDAWSLLHDGNATGPLHDDFAAAERVDVFLVSHHLLMLASLGVAVTAFGRKRDGIPVAAVALAALAPFIPVVLALEAAMTLYLAARAILNHRQRRSPGALQVAAGFSLFFIGHLSFFLLHRPGAGRSPLGDVLALVGIVLLVQLLPRPSE